MKKVTRILIFFLLITGCQKLKDLPKPKVLLSENKMVSMLIDITLANTMKLKAKKDMKNSGIDLKEFICFKHNVELDIFNDNLKFYSNDLKNYKRLFKRAEDSLLVRANKLDTIIKKSKDQHKEAIKVIDSIRE